MLDVNLKHHYACSKISYILINSLFLKLFLLHSDIMCFGLDSYRLYSRTCTLKAWCVTLPLSVLFLCPSALCRFLLSKPWPLSWLLCLSVPFSLLLLLVSLLFTLSLCRCPFLLSGFQPFADFFCLSPGLFPAFFPLFPVLFLFTNPSQPTPLHALRQSPALAASQSSFSSDSWVLPCP